MPKFPRPLEPVDRAIDLFTRRWGLLALRLSLAVIFIWFGLLKPLGLSPAAPLVRDTVAWMPGLTPEGWVNVIGWWEVLIGATFLFQRTVRIAIGLLALQMAGTFMPLVLLPGVTFQAGHVPYAPTLEGQYIIKNLLIIAAALVLGGTARHPDRTVYEV
ncbi:MAG: hypothetical protein H0T05_02180 [Acidobacteria bacterium]|nr:hypothetical protein [Acidobacteriota bacterium]MBA3887112.1 hypothetical protein [Acidobacteriota bacterium]